MEFQIGDRVTVVGTPFNGESGVVDMAFEGKRLSIGVTLDSGFAGCFNTDELAHKEELFTDNEQSTGLRRVVEAMSPEEREQCRATWQATIRANTNAEDVAYAQAIIATIDAVNATK